MKKADAIIQMNDFGKSETPFFFIINYKMDEIIIHSVEEARNHGILFNFKNSFCNHELKSEQKTKLSIHKTPVSFETYSKAFELVQKELHRGNSYLVNLTAKTPLECDQSLSDIYKYTKAKYKILFKDQFTVFSPETFVQIIDGKIFTYPMKGTIDASIPHAKHRLLNNDKELAEHATIVDLLRNDISQIASHVRLERFRYIDKINTSNKPLLQVSSKISGILPTNFHHHLGEIIFKMLPAGSITGAPKKKTMQIIAQAENYDRGFYTGIAGYFDGKNLDSCVLIRYIEQQQGKLFYKSGGGITTQSTVIEEYNELIDKIYVPTN